MSVCSLTLPACKEHALYYSDICGLSASAIFFHFISQMARLPEKIIDNTMCVLMFFTTFSETFPILRRIQRNIIINAYWHVKQPLLLSYFNENRVFSTYFRKTLKHNIPRKSLQWEPSCYMRTDGRTDMTELKVTFRNFADASKNEMTLYRQPLKET